MVYELGEATLREYEGTSLIGYMDSITAVEIDAVLKAYRSSGDGYKTFEEWCFTIDGEVLTIYDYKGDNVWHIGGRNKAHLGLLRKVFPNAGIW